LRRNRRFQVKTKNMRKKVFTHPYCTRKYG
jgi:hypothetical protein